YVTRDRWRDRYRDRWRDRWRDRTRYVTYSITVQKPLQLLGRRVEPRDDALGAQLLEEPRPTLTMPALALALVLLPLLVVLHQVACPVDLLLGALVVAPAVAVHREEPVEDLVHRLALGRRHGLGDAVALAA